VYVGGGIPQPMKPRPIPINLVGGFDRGDMMLKEKMPRLFTEEDVKDLGYVDNSSFDRRTYKP